MRNFPGQKTKWPNVKYRSRAVMKLESGKRMNNRRFVVKVKERIGNFIAVTI